MTNQNRKPRAIAIAVTRDAADLRRRLAAMAITSLSAAVAIAVLAASLLG